MSTRRILSLVVLFTLVLLAGGTTAQMQRAPITGEWRIEFDQQKTDEVHLSMTLAGKSRNNWGNNIGISEIQGLSRDVAMNSSVDVSLRIVRDGGTFELTGSFRNGKGSGHFTLNPNEQFLAALATRGYPDL